MPKKKKDIEAGKDSSQDTKTSSTLSEVIRHYQDAKAELEIRITDKDRGFDVYDRIYRNYINPAKWPFSARVPDGRGSSLLKRKTDRLLANRLSGRMVPSNENGSELGAILSSELVNYEWNQVDLKTDETMISRWRRIDLNARKYGAGFGYVPWKKEGSRFEGPTIEPIENRNVLLQPGNGKDWVQIRRYVTIAELESANDMATTGPIYSKEVINELKTHKTKSTEYTSINKQVIGLSDNSQSSERIEIITEYRRDKWITFCPYGSKDGDVLREIPNPYKHGEIPMLKLIYDAIDDDSYGVPELENVLPLIKSSWALISQYLEQSQTELFTPLQVNPQNVQLDTLTFKPGARWLMNNPGQDVVKFDGGSVAMNQFQGVYGLITSLIMEGVGETGQDVSVLGGGVQDKTATEVKDMAMLRTARDNSNKLALQQAIGKMVYWWHEMNKQFITEEKMIRISGKDAIKYLMKEQMHDRDIDDTGAALVASYAQENGTEEEPMSFEQAYSELAGSGQLEQYITPIYPNSQGQPKLAIDNEGKGGMFSITGEDIGGEYDYVVDIEAMGIPNDQSEIASRTMVSELMLKTQQNLLQDGYKVKWKEFLEDLGEKAKLKNMEQYFEMAQQPMAQPGMPGQSVMEGAMQDPMQGQADPNMLMQQNGGQPTGAVPGAVMA